MSRALNIEQFPVYDYFSISYNISKKMQFQLFFFLTSYTSQKDFNLLN